MNWRKHAYLLGHDLIGSRLRQHYREFLHPPAQLAKVQQERLAAVLAHARASVPYYRERVSRPELGAFTVLKKTDLQTHFTALMEPSLLHEYQAAHRPRGYSWTAVKTGGSTGAPTVVIHDREMRDWGRAGRLYSQHLCGFPIGTPFFKLWGSMRDINAGRESRQQRILGALQQAEMMNAFLMDEARMTQYVAQMNSSPTRHLMAYVDAADELARFIEKRALTVRPLESIQACAGTVTEAHRERLGRVFGARVHNKYGSRECSDMACECAHGGFHIYTTGVVLEIVDGRDQPVPAGVAGRILVTLLHNRRFPLIRYEIGDVGALTERTCACGSPFPLLERVEGRTSEFVTAADGAYVSPVYLRHLIGVVHHAGAMARFQFVQRGLAEYALALQMDPDFSSEAFEQLTLRLRRDLLKVLGDSATLTIERTPQLAASESGKFLYVRNLHRQATP